MPNKNPSLFFDTVVLSNFAFVEGGLSLLKERYQTRGMITLQVMQEITKATYLGYHQLDNFESKIISAQGFRKTFLKHKEQIDYLIFLKNLGEGEASCLSCALHRNGIVATDDRLARNYCKEKNVLFTGTIGILKAAQQDGLISLEIADHMLQQMIKHGFYSPVNKISDLL